LIFIIFETVDESDFVRPIYKLAVRAHRNTKKFDI